MISDQEKHQFLLFLRSGEDPATAAQHVNPEYTGSIFRRLTHEHNANYDPHFAAEYLRARAEGRKVSSANPDSAPPRTTTLNGHVKAAYLTEEMLEQFCEEVAGGTPLYEAAASLEPKTTLTQINRRANRDPLFAQMYADAKEQGYPNFQEKLRSNIVKMAFNGEYRAARDLALLHLPEFRELMSQKHEISGPGGDAIRLLAERVLPGLPPEMLNKLIEEVERRQIEP